MSNELKLGDVVIARMDPHTADLLKHITSVYGVASVWNVSHITEAVDKFGRYVDRDRDRRPLPYIVPRTWNARIELRWREEIREPEVSVTYDEDGVETLRWLFGLDHRKD